MDKPISIIIEETKMQIAKIINESGLPPIIVEPIIKDIYMECQNAKVQQIAYDKKNYEESVTSEES